MLLADEDGIEVPYVVKLFNHKDSIEQHPVFKEVVGSMLAREFSLQTPEIALADFSPGFITNVLEKEQQDILKQKSPELKFASRLLDSPVIYTPAIHKSYLKDYDFANLYAFDCLLYNIDRGRKPDKPNVFVHDSSFVLFDHELSLPFIDNQDSFYLKILDDFSKDILNYSYQQHLCYPYLKAMRPKEKKGLFDEFEEHLRLLNLQELERATNDLLSLNISCGHYDRFLEYLYRFGKAAPAFCNLLLRTIL